MNLLKSIFKFKCPRCRVGNLFLNNNPYILRDLNKMHKRCDNCNLKFSIEPGFFQGAAYVSYGLQVLSSLIVFNCFFWLTNIRWQNIVYILLFTVILATPYVVILSRAIWLHMFISHKGEF